MKATGQVFSANASTSSGSLISGTGSMIGKGAPGLADAGGNVFDKLGIDTQLDNKQLNKQLQRDVVAALKKAEFLRCNLNLCSSN